MESFQWKLHAIGIKPVEMPFFFSLEIVHYEVDRLIVNKQLGVYEVAVKAA